MKLRHRHQINYRLARVIFAASLRHYSNIMQRILLVYKMYAGVYFALFSLRLRLRVYRLYKRRGAFLPAVQRCARVPTVWVGRQALWQWSCPPREDERPCLDHLRPVLAERAQLLEYCGYMQDSNIKKYRVGVLQTRTAVLCGGSSGHLCVTGRRLWVERFISSALLPRLDYSLWVVYKQMQFHMDMGSWRGRRYRACLPVRGQRTRTNSRTVRQVTRALLERY